MKQFFQKARLRRLISEAHSQGVLDAQAKDRALELVPIPTQWWWGIDKLLLVLGTIQVLAGILFFFAFNWQDMPPWVKFALLQTALITCLGAGWYKGFTTATGKVLLMAAALILGVLMAVFGQTYQTGADSFELFRAWAVLLLPWAVLVRFGPLWLFWMVVANLALGLYLTQAGYRFIGNDFNPFSLFMACFNLLIFLAGEVWQRFEIPRIPVWIAGLFFSAAPVYIWVAELGGPSGSQWKALLLWTTMIVGGCTYFYRKRPDFNTLALAVLSFAGLVATLLVRILAEIEGPAALLFSGFTITAIISATIVFLYRLRRSMEGPGD